MNCSEVQSRLSAFVDGEATTAEQQAMDAHLAGCASCAESVSLARKLGYQMRELADPAPPAGLWQSIEAQLLNTPTTLPLANNRSVAWWSAPAVRWALAASILVVTSVGMGIYYGAGWSDPHGAGSAHSHRHEAMAATFDTYLERFAVDPANAHQVLLAAYDSQPVTAESAIGVLGYRPIASTALLPNMKVAQTFVLDMPCCRCSLSVCRRQDGSVVTLLEHQELQPTWFGERPRIECLCDGVPTSVVQVGAQLAASWSHDDRHITLIGANDLEEVTRLVSGLNQAAGDSES